MRSRETSPRTLEFEAVVAVEVGAELLGGAALGPQAQQREDLRLAAAQRQRAPAEHDARLAPEQLQVEHAGGAGPAPSSSRRTR